MKCIILAAGYATRLSPLTDNFPKPLLPVRNKPILDWLIEDIATIGMVDEYIVVSNHKFAAHFIEWAAGKKQMITVLDDGTESNETRLGAVVDIRFAVDSLGVEDDTLVIAGDNLLDFSLTTFLRYAEDKKTSCGVRYYEQSVERLKKCGVLKLDEHDRILRMTEKPAEPESHWACPPFYFYRKEDIKRIPEALSEGCGYDAPGSFLAWLSGKTTVHAMEMPGKRYDIGNLQSYREVQEHYHGILCNTEKGQ